MTRLSLLGLALALAVAGFAACGEAEGGPVRAEATPSPRTPAQSPGASEAPSGPIARPALRLPAPERLVALGDVHGDLAATRRALRLAGAIDAADRWSGGHLVVVQTGDQLDRGSDEPEILALFERLRREAADAGGAFVVLNGNHEIMNALGDLRYVTPEGFRDYADTPPLPNEPTEVREAPAEIRGRLRAFLPRSQGALTLSRRNVVQIVGDSLFVHGGVHPEHVTAGLDALNLAASRFLRGEGTPPDALLDPEGPVWTRTYSDEPDAADCARAARTLEAAGVTRMILGHTPHTAGVARHCDGKVWVVDVGMAAYYGGPTEVLEIRGDRVNVLR